MAMRAATYNTARRLAVNTGVPILESEEIVAEKLIQRVDDGRSGFVQLTRQVYFTHSNGMTIMSAPTINELRTTIIRRSHVAYWQKRLTQSVIGYCRSRSSEWKTFHATNIVERKAALELALKS